MTSTMTRTRRTSEAGAVPLRLSPPRHRRRGGLLTVSLVLLTTCTALFVSAYLRASHQIAVLAVAKPVAQGAQLVPGDLSIIRISSSGGLDPVAASAASRVVGDRAAVGLEPGSLLTMSDVSDTPEIGPEQAVVGVALKPGQLPADGLTPGDSVDVIFTGVPGVDGSSSDVDSATPVLSATVLASQVLVTAVEPPTVSSESDTVGVSILVPRDVAGAIASAATAGEVALVAVSGQP